MRKHDPQTREDGFHYLLPRVDEYLDALIAEFRKESEHGLRRWLLELIGHSKNPAAYPLLAEFAKDKDDSLREWAIKGLRNLDTKEARTLLYELDSCR
jgi:HEAT repeat protein